MKFWSFYGRANRAEFWQFQLISFVIGVAGYAGSAYGSMLEAFMGVLLLFVAGYLAAAVQVRRLHDMDRSGWWSLLFYVPIVQFFMLIWLGCWSGVNYGNRYDSHRFYDTSGPIR